MTSNSFFLKDLTPLKFRCVIGNCPAVFEENNKKYLRIIGQQVDFGELAHRVGQDEQVIRIDRELLQNTGGPISRYLMRLGL